jgi:hypothetical protein
LLGRRHTCLVAYGGILEQNSVLLPSFSSRPVHLKKFSPDKLGLDRWPTLQSPPSNLEIISTNLQRFKRLKKLTIAITISKANRGPIEDWSALVTGLNLSAEGLGFDVGR